MTLRGRLAVKIAALAISIAILFAFQCISALDMSNFTLDQLDTFLEARDCETPLHRQVWGAKRQECPVCHARNPGVAATRNRQQVIELDDNGAPTAGPSTARQPSPSRATTALVPAQVAQRSHLEPFGHGTGTYNILHRELGEKKRHGGSQRLANEYNKQTSASQNAFDFRAQAVRKQASKSEQQIGVTWHTWYIVWTKESYPKFTLLQSCGMSRELVLISQTNL